MVEDAHLLEHLQVESVVVWSELSKANATILVHDSSHLKHCIWLHQILLAFELNNSDLRY